MDTLQLIDKVNSFYSNSFSQLITLTIAIMGFSGIVLPIVIQFIQTRIFRTEQRSLQSQISQEIQTATQGLHKEIEGLFAIEKENIKRLVDEQIASLNKLVQEKSALATGNSFFLQANSNLDKSAYAQASSDFARAARWLFAGKDDLNGQRALDLLIKRCLVFTPLLRQFLG